MDFKECYKKYLNGTATAEEISFVEAEIEKARMINSEIISSSGTDNMSANYKASHKDKAKKSPRQTIRTIIISFIVAALVIVLAIGGFYAIAVYNAKKNVKVSREDATLKATNEAYIYARDHLNYSGSMKEMTVSEKIIDELNIKFPLKKCCFIYEYEIIVGNHEIEVEVNSKTGNTIKTDVDELDDINILD